MSRKNCLNWLNSIIIFHFRIQEGYIGHQLLFLLVIFAFLSLQNVLGYFFQIRQYQKMIRKWLGKGIIGIGQRRGLFTPGEILILVYNPREDAVITVQSMRGYSIFVRFKEKLECSGLSLEELRRLGLDADRRDLKLWRVFFRYKPQKPSKQKGALIQAVEAVTRKLAAGVSEVPAIQEFLATVSPAHTFSEPSAETWHGRVSHIERDNAGHY